MWWVPCIALSTYTITLASLPSFAPSDLAWLNTYLLLLGFFVGPKAIFALCSFLGSCLMRLTGWPRINLGHYIGILLGCGGVLAYIYGLTVGVRQVKVNHLTLQFDDLPAAFDGYKILHISDLHLGTFYGWRQKILQAEMDSIARQHADLMVFTGDVQNIRPQEIFSHTDLLRSTTQGMVSVLGNHDYASYAKDTHEAQDRLLRLLVETEQNALGWRLLRNDHLVIRRGGDSLVVAGTENDGEPPFPNLADTRKSLEGVRPGAFVVMLQHDPSAWRRDILPKTTAQLTLSGHTHGGQMQFFGHRPTQWRGRPDKGLYEQQGRYLYVNAGLGGLVPFRLNMPNEITVITLRTKHRPADPVAKDN